MAIFKYKSVNEIGQMTQGRIDAVNEPDLEARLQSMGQELVSYHEVTHHTSFFQRKKITRQDLINFCFHMEQMSRAGVSILESLIDFRDSSENPRFRETISAMISSIEGGKTLSQALSEFPTVFDNVFVSLIEAGEQAGELDTVLKRMTESLKWQDEIASKTHKLLIYPVVVSVVITAVIFFLMIYLVPQLVSFIKNLGKEIPLYTRLLIYTSNFMINFWYLIVISPFAISYTIKRLAKSNQKFRYKLDEFKLNLWIFGPVMRKLILARFATYFALLYRSGITVLHCLKINEAIAGNLVIEQALAKVGQLTSDGSTLTNSVQQVNLFPPLVVRAKTPAVWMNRWKTSPIFTIAKLTMRLIACSR